jgi:hypothetical protein
MHKSYTNCYKESNTLTDGTEHMINRELRGMQIRWKRDARYLEFVCPSFFFARPRTPRHQNFGFPAKNFGVRDAGTHLNGNAGCELFL